MVYVVIQCALSGIIITVVSEVAKRSPSLAALIVSLKRAGNESPASPRGFAPD